LFAAKITGHYALHIIPVVNSQRYWSLCIALVAVVCSQSSWSLCVTKCCVVFVVCLFVCLKPKQIVTVHYKVLLSFAVKTTGHYALNLLLTFAAKATGHCASQRFVAVCSQSSWSL
jgi:hypothetical protein